MRRAWPLGLLLVGAASAAEPPQTASITLEPVTVTATRVAVAGFDVPTASSVVQAGEPGLGASLGEWLQGVPGLMARERQNWAQDTQISIRGFGARAPFGLRGVRLYVDGIPATQPDGQGQISHFNLASAARVEVLRGPFSALYGNASGGVIELFTQDADGPPSLEFAAFGGSHGNQRYSLVARGEGITLAYSHLQTDGYREHSAAKRNSVNLKADVATGGGGKLSLTLNHFDAPDAQDTLGLTRTQWQADARQATAAALAFNTRKSVQQTQFGLSYQRAPSRYGSLRLLGYGGSRGVEQYLAVPVAVQASPTHSGGVVDLANRYYGGDLRFTTPPGPYVLVGGITSDVLDQQRLGFENFAGGQLGVRGNLRRDELDTVTSFDQYLQLNAALSPAWSALVGARNSTVRFRTRDHYIAPGNPDDSGGVRYSAFTPVAGLLYRQSSAVHWYGAYGSGFETPTFAELAYRPDGAAGLNLGLAPARSRNAELGVKLRLPRATQLGLAVFQVRSKGELFTVSNSGGRASFANAARTQRQGFESELNTRLAEHLKLSLAYTWLDANVRGTGGTCASPPCASANALPGVAQSQLWSQLVWTPLEALRVSAELRHLSKVYVNDRNSEFAPAYTVLDTALSYQLLAPHLRATLRLDNLLDEQYVGSVIVNEANGRYYEPAPGRTVLMGLEWTL